MIPGSFPGFRVALPRTVIPGLPGVTPELFNEFREQHTSYT